MEGEGGGVCHATDRPRSGDPLLHACPGRLPHRGRPVHRPAARQARRKAPGGPPWLNSVTAVSSPGLGFGSSTASRSIISHPRRRTDRVATDVRYWPILLKKSCPASDQVSKNCWCAWRFWTWGTASTERIQPVAFADALRDIANRIRR